MGQVRWFGLLSLVSALAACGGEPGSSLRLLEFRQQDFGSVALNEELLFFFSDDLDPASVTSDSLRILDERGQPVDGERLVRGNALSFLPDLPRASDLSDGGLRPGSSYHVILGGFPRLDGIRSERGTLLSACLRLDFRTADVGGTSPLFLDPFVGPFLFWPRGARTYPVELPDGRLILEYGEALDPSSVPRARFELSHYPPGSSEPVPIPVQARLIENHRSHAALLLEPIGPAGAVESLPPDRYYLRMPGRTFSSGALPSLRTLGGRAVEPGWGYGVLELLVPRKRVEVDFADWSERYTELAGGCDGTAIWRGGEGLGIRFPKAAGTGEAGEVELRAAPDGADLQATVLRVPAGEQVQLDPAAGPLVLRSQTSLVIEGRLGRLGSGRPGDPITLEMEAAMTQAPARWERLSDWLQRLLSPGQPWAGEPWTVLIAGGDLLVPPGGVLEVEGPLVLVAGGRIRVEGVAVSHGNLWRTPEGGGMASYASNRLLPLALDPPETNPLRVPLTVGALGPEIPWSPGRERWRTTLVGHEGSGHIRTQFLQSGSDGELRLVEDPGELERGVLRPLLRLSMPPGQGEVWDPPLVERLLLEALSGTVR